MICFGEAMAIYNIFSITFCPLILILIQFLILQVFVRHVQVYLQTGPKTRHSYQQTKSNKKQTVISRRTPCNFLVYPLERTYPEFEILDEE